MTQSATTEPGPWPRPRGECWEAGVEQAGDPPAPALTSEQLARCERELHHLVVREAASPAAREAASAFNVEASAAMGGLLQPARALLEGGGAVPASLGACIARKVAEIAFWRRVLCGAYPDDFAAPSPPADFLVRYLLTC